MIVTNNLIITDADVATANNYAIACNALAQSMAKWYDEECTYRVTIRRRTDRNDLALTLANLDSFGFIVTALMDNEEYNGTELIIRILRDNSVIAEWRISQYPEDCRIDVSKYL